MGFIENIVQYVQKYAPQYNIKVYSPIIAQAILESASGTSTKAAYHNYFGLKYRAGRCPTSNGTFIDRSAEQNADGTYRPITASWFSFPNMEAGVKGYFDFINITNYAKTKGETDPQKYLQALKDASYATSIDYVQKNMNVIEKYNLTQYDPEFSKVVVPRKIKVAVDAGHGSNTAGKRTPDDYREHWINVNTAFFLAMALESNGFEVYKSGWNDNNSKDDPDTALSIRQKNIKAEQCDCSISCHANAAGTGGWSAASGVETLIHSNPAYQADSKRLADLVQAHLEQGTKQKSRGVKTQTLAMCNCSAMGTQASILCEIGFMTNKEEAELMKTSTFCAEQATDICKGVCEYYNVKYHPWQTGKVVVPIEITPETGDNAKLPFLVKVTDFALNIREKPSALSRIMGVIRDKGIYTIVEVQGNWGRLKSGAGWINLKYTVRE